MKLVLRSAVGMIHVLRSRLVMDFMFPIDRVGIPFGFQPIVWTFVRHTVGRCLIFPAFEVTWSIWTCCFSGLLPLRSLTNGQPIWVRFQECLVVRLHSEIDQIHLSIEAQCVTTLLPLGDCHNWNFEILPVKMRFCKALHKLG